MRSFVVLKTKIENKCAIKKHILPYFLIQLGG